jgi:hypothetical protein
MNKCRPFQSALRRVFIASILCILSVDNGSAQNPDEFIYVQSIPANSRVYLIKEADQYKNWEMDEKTFVGTTPLTKKLAEGDYLLVVRSQKSAGQTFFNKNQISDGETGGGYLVVGNQGEVDLYKQYTIKKLAHFPITLTTIFMQYGNSLEEILKNVAKRRNFDYDFKPEAVSGIFQNLKIQPKDIATATDLLKKTGVLSNENGFVCLTTAGGIRSSIENFDPPLDLTKFSITLSVTPGKKRETITFKASEYADGTKIAPPKSAGASTQSIVVDKRVLDVVNAWDKDIRMFTSKANPLQSFQNLRQRDIAAWGAELMLNVNQLYAALSITEDGVRIIGTGNAIFDGMDNAPRLFITWSKFEADLKGAIRIELKEKR